MLIASVCITYKMRFT